MPPPPSKYSTPRPSRRWAFMIIWTGFLIFFIIDGINYADGVFLDTFRSEFDISPYVASSYTSIARGCCHIAAIFVGPLTQRFSCSIVCMGCIILGTISLFISSFATNIIYLCFSYGLGYGTAISGTALPCLICATLYFRKHRGLAVGLISSASGWGSFAFAPLATYLTDRYSWRTVYRLYALIVLIGIIPATFLRPQSPLKTCQQLFLGSLELWYKTWAEATRCCRDTDDQPLSPASAEILTDEEEDEEENDMVVHPVSAPVPRRLKVQRAATKEIKKIRTIYHDHCVVLCCVAGFVSTAGIYVPPAYLVSYAVASGASTDKASYLLSMFGLANMASRVMLGWFVDLKYLNAVAVYCLGTLVGGLATVVVWKYNSFTALAVYAVVFGISFGCNLSMVSVVLVQLLGLAAYQDIYPIVNFWCGIGALIGPPGLGYLYEVTHKYYTVFMIAGVVLALGSFFWLMTPFLMAEDVTGPIKVHLSMSPLEAVVMRAFMNTVETDSPSPSDSITNVATN